MGKWIHGGATDQKYIYILKEQKEGGLVRWSVCTKAEFEMPIAHPDLIINYICGQLCMWYISERPGAETDLGVISICFPLDLPI